MTLAEKLIHNGICQSIPAALAEIQQATRDFERLHLYGDVADLEDFIQERWGFSYEDGLPPVLIDDILLGSNR